MLSLTDLIDLLYKGKREKTQQAKPEQAPLGSGAASKARSVAENSFAYQKWVLEDPGSRSGVTFPQWLAMQGQSTNTNPYQQ